MSRIAPATSRNRGAVTSTTEQLECLDAALIGGVR